MKVLRQIYVLLMVLLCIQSAHASFLESCHLKAKVLEPTSTIRAYIQDAQGNEFEEYRLNLWVQVQEAKPNSRADLGCKYFVGKKIKIDVTNPPVIAFKKNQWVELNYSAKDGKSMARRENYELIKNKH